METCLPAPSTAILLVYGLFMYVISVLCAMAEPSVGSDNLATAVNDSGQLINDTAGKNITEKVPATPEGMAIAYSSLVVMALVPIFFGSFRSVRYHREQKVGGFLLL